MNKPFDERKVLEESLVTLLERRSNGGGNRYKIIDIDGSELSLEDLLKKYFFNSKHHTSCSVILTKSYNKVIEDYSIKESQEEKIDTQEGKQEELFECYYCNAFPSTNYKPDYERHVVLKHPGKLAYPSIVDLKKMNISPKGKEWEI